jgi:hypothetical protein
MRRPASTKMLASVRLLIGYGTSLPEVVEKEGA